MDKKEENSSPFPLFHKRTPYETRTRRKKRKNIIKRFSCSEKVKLCGMAENGRKMMRKRREVAICYPKRGRGTISSEGRKEEEGKEQKKRSCRIIQFEGRKKRKEKRKWQEIKKCGS